MHHTKKGNKWYFALKANIGLDRKDGAVHSVCTSAVNMADVHILPDLLYGEEHKAWSEAGY
jgi:IS5 family transposase